MAKFGPDIDFGTVKATYNPEAMDFRAANALDAKAATMVPTGAGGIALASLGAGLGGLMDRANEERAAEAEELKLDRASRRKLNERAGLDALERLDKELGHDDEMARLEDEMTLKEGFAERAEKRKEAKAGELSKGTAERYSMYRDTIQKVAADADLPPELLAGIIAQESDFNPRAVGDNGVSVGLGQLQTKSGRGAEIIRRSEGRLNRDAILNAPPEQQIFWTAEYLMELKDRFTRGGQTDWDKVIDAYNKGPGGVGGKSGDPNYIENVRKRMAQIRAFESSIGIASAERDRARAAGFQADTAKANAATAKARAEEVRATGGLMEDAPSGTVTMNGVAYDFPKFERELMKRILRDPRYKDATDEQIDQFILQKWQEKQKA